MSFPTKAERKECYIVRDKYWACLDEHAPTYIASPGSEEPEKCRKARKLYEAGCLSQWVKHFEERRAYEQAKKIKIMKYKANAKS